MPHSRNNHDHIHDNINHALAAWDRNASFSHLLVGKLDFAGWRQFRVPALGDGQQASGSKGSTPKIDAPIGLLAFTIKAGKPNTPRSLWVDDLAVETQVGVDERISLETERSDPAGRLTADGKIMVSVGNGVNEVRVWGDDGYLWGNLVGYVEWH